MHKRFEIRRSSKILTEVAAPTWDLPVELVASDLSPRGMYLQSEELPAVGEHMFLAFSLSFEQREYCFLSRVNRINLRRRKTDVRPPGFGVEFLDISPINRLRIRSSIRALPIPLPADRRGNLFDSPVFEIAKPLL